MMHTQNTTTKPSAQTAEKIAHRTAAEAERANTEHVRATLNDLIDTLQAERDELLEALKDLVNAVDPAPVGLDLEPYFRLPADKAWAAIAKVEGSK